MAPRSKHTVTVDERLDAARHEMRESVARLVVEKAALAAQLATLRAKSIASHEEICQTLGLALGYPRYCDDQINFPGSTEAHGVCVGDQVAETLALQAAERITALTQERNGWGDTAQAFAEQRDAWRARAEHAEAARDRLTKEAPDATR